MAVGFASPDALIALTMLNLGPHRPASPAADDPWIAQGEPDYDANDLLASLSPRANLP